MHVEKRYCFFCLKETFHNIDNGKCIVCRDDL